MSATTSSDHADACCGSIAEVISTGKDTAVKKFVLHRIAIIVAAIAVGSAGIATDALARGGGGGGHFGGGMGAAHFGGMGGGHFGGAMGGGHLGRIGGEHFGGRAEHQRYGYHRGSGYYGDYDACWSSEQVRPRRLRYF